MSSGCCTEYRPNNGPSRPPYGRPFSACSGGTDYGTASSASEDAANNRFFHFTMVFAVVVCV